MRRGVVVWVLCLAMWPALGRAAERNLIALHRGAENVPQKECLSCHGAILEETTGNRKIKTMHRLHLESRRDTPKTCSSCHRSVDLREGSAGALRKQVDPAVCVECHSGGLEGARVLFAR